MSAKHSLGAGYSPIADIGQLIYQRRMSQLQFFALPEDWVSVLRAVEERRAFEIALAGLSTTPNLVRFNSLVDLPNLGTADQSAGIGCLAYLVSFADAPIEVRYMKTTAGDAYFVDQLLNPDAVTFTPAGRWRDNVIVQGALGSAHNTEKAKSLMRAFRTAISKHFRRVNYVWVGEAALRKWEAGWRLTAAAQSPPEFDLAR